MQVQGQETAGPWGTDVGVMTARIQYTNIDFG
jgi:hypothetical protein